ncbi:PREDICTED: meprin A subunit alpha [Gavialis gangeticus]|uniref:meprin A subunit alpha n=1 Tax=Gavialis gangeticus TaxID=94835 RepID=UPI00092E6366|nr:PREDICTED: meprin A subunit alpha [Gavialis gangeticus]
MASTRIFSCLCLIFFFSHCTSFSVRQHPREDAFDADAGQLRKDIPEINLAAGLDLFQGDILLPKERNALRNESYRWKFPIPYILADDLNLNAKGVILEAFEMFRLKSCVDFKPYEGESTYILFQQGSGCWSMVGDLQTGQNLSIGLGCDYKAIVEHEILHALGFYHEQSRTDRDDYVNIWWNEVISGYEHNFVKYDDQFITDLNTPYDYESVMHYAPFSFNKNESFPTITAKIPVFDDIIGQRLDFSALDIERLNRMYNCTSTHTFLDQCAFEHANICGMVQGTRDDADWVHQKSSLVGQEDYTLAGRCKDAGYVMYFDTSSGRAENAAILESRILYPKRAQQCLQFFYKMTGSPLDKLIIWVMQDDGTGKVRQLSKVKMFQGDADLNWKIAHVTLNVQKKFRYLFQGLSGNPNISSGGISIDDVTLTETPCPSAVWVIRNFSQIFRTTTKNDFMLSPRFYSPEGYGYGITLFPHGHINSFYDNYSRIAFHLCSGDNDAVLEWPAENRQAILTVIDQDPDVRKRMSASRSFTTDKTQVLPDKNDTSMWDKPSLVGKYDESCKCFRSLDWGWSTFISHKQLTQRSFLKHDNLIIFAEFHDLTHLNKTEVPIQSPQPASDVLVLERQKRSAQNSGPMRDWSSSVRDPCDPNPCQNDGVCVNVKGKASCRCPSGQAFFYTGERCQTAQVHGNIVGMMIGGAAGTIVLTIVIISMITRK